MKSKVYNQQGKEIGTIDLPEAIFAVRWNGDLVHTVFTAFSSRARASVAHVKDRSEVRGGGKKPWRQKGTGRARHGSRRSPIWRHGGVTFGPRNEKNFSRKINKKEKIKALRIVLSRKLRDNEIIFLDSIAIDTARAKTAKSILDNLGNAVKNFSVKKRNAAYIFLAEKNSVLEKSFRNFGNIFVGETRNMNISDVAKCKYIVIVNPEKSFKILLKENNK